MSGGGTTTSHMGPATVAGGAAITWHRPAAANVARNSGLLTRIGRHQGPARLRRFRTVRIGLETSPPRCETAEALEWSDAGGVRCEVTDESD